MIKFFKIFIFLLFTFVFFNVASAKEGFFNEGVKLFDAKKYDEAKFLFERSIVFEPKHAKSYLYLAKIYKEKENQKKELLKVENNHHQL